MPKSPTGAYRDDLAYIHDAGFGQFAKNAAEEVLKLLRQAQKADGLVIDLGCGSGIFADAISGAGYDILGFDLSAAMVALARRRVPRGEFRQESFLTASLPPCIAVTAIGEVFNYLFDSRNDSKRLAMLFQRIYDALPRGGLFVFDVATPGRAGKSGRQRNYSQGTDWACLFTAEEDPTRQILTRQITSFRKLGDLYRRDDEVHRLRLLNRLELAAQLRNIGFRLRTLSGYGPLRFPAGYVGFVARKP
ncbi:MAG TPA: methyltransferase domain-containing protein [Pirellulales bacterium]|nr:methyltransferase domain-containing protein [Pirellulales bacterium]